MVVDGLMVAFGAFGFSAFCFVAGYVAGGSKREGSATFPLAHVSFDPSASDVDRLKLLDEARAAVLDGRLSQSKNLKNCCSADQASKPGNDLEE